MKYELLNLVGLIFDLTLENGMMIGDMLSKTLNNLQNLYFPIHSKELKSETRDRWNFEMIFEGFLNVLVFSRHPKALKLLYWVIWEEKTLLKDKLTRSINVFVEKGINDMNCMEFFKTTLKEF